MEKLEGRTAFITGGAQGIGLGIARALARRGVKLALVDIDAEALEAATSELSKHTPTEAFELDVRDRARFAEVAELAESKLGPVSLLFNNAGVASEPAITQMTYEMWDWVLGINLQGVINGVQTFLPRLLERGGDAHIVNTASGAGLVVIGAGAMYTTSKFAVVGLSEALRNGLAKHGIGVSVLCPGYVATGIVAHSAALSPAPPVAQEATSQKEVARREKRTAALAQGTAIDDVGEIVLAAIRDERLFIYTDDMIATYLEQRHQELVEAFATTPNWEPPQPTRTSAH